MTAAHRPRRSCLYVPAINQRAAEKARGLKADVIILDLEDSVAPEEKVTARELACAFLQSGGFGEREIFVRINALDGDWGMQDLAACAAAGASGILAPKVEREQHIAALNTAMSAAGAGDHMQLWAMIEMPAAILNIAAISAAAQTTRLSGFVMGLNDLAKETGAAVTPDRAAFQVALQTSLLAARANGLIAIDSVFNDFSNESGLIAECEQGRMLGFDGKSLIHPAQVDPANRIFAPSTEALEKAQKIVEAFALLGNLNKGVIKIEGQMTERLHLEQAMALLAQQAAIDAANR